MMIGSHRVLIRDDEDNVVGMEKCNLSFSFSGHGSLADTQKFREVCRRPTDLPEMLEVLSSLRFEGKTQPVCLF